MHGLHRFIILTSYVPNEYFSKKHIHFAFFQKGNVFFMQTGQIRNPYFGWVFGRGSPKFVFAHQITYGWAQSMELLPPFPLNYWNMYLFYPIIFREIKG